MAMNLPPTRSRRARPHQAALPRSCLLPVMRSILPADPENRFSVRLFLTAIAIAFRCPMSTTSFLPRVMPV